MTDEEWGELGFGILNQDREIAKQKSEAYYKYLQDRELIEMIRKHRAKEKG